MKTHPTVFFFFHANTDPHATAPGGPGNGDGHGVWLMLGLLSGVCGAMPSWMLDHLIAALAALFQAFGAEAAGGCVFLLFSFVFVK